jgi:hypothetical protein
VTCDEFDAEVDELAVGAVSEPRRSELLAHVATCPSCAARLRQLSDVADRLLLLAPTVEPPAGFESRVVSTAPAAGSSWTTWRRSAAGLAVAAALVGAVLVGRVTSPDEQRHQAAIVAVSGGATVGRIELVADPAPHVVIAIDHPRPGPGVRSCELERADGSTVVVGSWTYDEIESGVWAAGIDRSLLDAVAMHVIDNDGTVIATARFD